MPKSPVHSVIRLKGARHNNLKNFDLDLPLNRLIVITGLSGSGKSSLAFDTLFAEGQRRYVETFSPYARQFLDRMDKPQVDAIEGIPPAIAIEQRNAVRSTRSTVGTMTEICDYMKMLWVHIADLYCRECGRLVRKDSPQSIWTELQKASDPSAEHLIVFSLPLSEKLSLADSLELVGRQGYQRLLVGDRIVRLEEADSLGATLQKTGQLTVIQDRVKLVPGSRARFIEACEQAAHFGKGALSIVPLLSSDSIGEPRRFSNRLHCASCDIAYPEPSPALFSFNHPVGACPACKGFGRIIRIDYDLAMPDRSRTLAQGVVKPWLSGQSAECQQDLMRTCRQFHIPTDVPFDQLPERWQKLVIDGEPGYGKDPAHEWPNAWYGVKGYFRWLESKAYKMHVRVLLSRYRAYTLCPDCQGARFQPQTLLYRAKWHPPGQTGESQLTLADFYRLTVKDACHFANRLITGRPGGRDPMRMILEEVTARLGFLNEVGLGYLTLDRPTRSLSGGETERVNLTTCLGSRLVNTLFVLDEPSVGLHPRDTARLVSVLKKLRDGGNTVVVVEHEALVMRAADQIIDLGPGHGATGGQVVFQGTYDEILRSEVSLTGRYLRRRDGNGTGALHLHRRGVSRDTCELGEPGPEPLALHDLPMPLPSKASMLTLRNVRFRNLRNLTVRIPLGRFVCVTGVSGSGKTTLVREVLYPALVDRLKRAGTIDLKASDRLAEDAAEETDSEDLEASPGARQFSLEGWESLQHTVLVDQAVLGKTPRSNPAVYTGAFDDIRELFAQSEEARQRGLNASAFSFNSSQGQCERCRGAGFEKIEMQFLSDVFVRCPDCEGRRYREHILRIKISPPAPASQPTGERKARRLGTKPPAALSIGDVLEATIDEVLEFLKSFGEQGPARRARQSLSLLQEVGLGYLKLGQPINTLSGGESQRLKLVRELAESGGDQAETSRRTLFLFDEPTTGLHFEDVRVLLAVFKRLVRAGHSVLVIEHNLDVIEAADWVVDLGPEAGEEGGLVVAEGSPADIAESTSSHTGSALRDHMGAAISDLHPVTTRA